MKHLPYVFSLMIITTACEQVVDIEIPEHQSQLVLSSFYEAGENIITAHLTKSVALAGGEVPSDVRGATVNLYADNVPMGQFEEITGGASPIYVLQFAEPLKEGITYRLTAEASGYTGISASQTITGFARCFRPFLPPKRTPSCGWYFCRRFEAKTS